MDRKDELLKAAYEYLKNVDNSEYQDALGVPVFYDEAECDGYCLANDIANECGYEELI